MLGLIGFLATVAATAAGFLQARAFVYRRLRFVSAARRPAAPLLAGAAAALLATPVVWLLPLVGSGTALLFGAGVGAGVLAGARALRRRLPAP